MNIYLCLFSLFSSFSFYFVKSYKPKFCVNCKYFIQDHSLSKMVKYGRCTKFPKENQNEMEYLITGEKNKAVDSFHYCTTVRDCDDKCGKEGKYYRRKSVKDEPIVSNP